MNAPHNPPPLPFGSHQTENAAAPAPEGAAHPAEPSGASSCVSRSAMEQLLAMRLRQMEQYGHTPDADMARPISDLVAAMNPYTRYLREDITCHAPLVTIKKHAAALGAMCLALIDRVEGEEERRHG